VRLTAIKVEVEEIASLPDNTLALNNIYVVQDGTVEVLKDWKNRYKGVVEATLAGMTYKWERQPHAGGAWATIGTTMTLEYSEATVGDFDVRFVVSFGGSDYVSDERRVQVCDVEVVSFMLTKGADYQRNPANSGHVISPAPAISYDGKVEWKAGSPVGADLKQGFVQSVAGTIQSRHNIYGANWHKPPASPGNLFDAPIWIKDDKTVAAPVNDRPNDKTDYLYGGTAPADIGVAMGGGPPFEDSPVIDEYTVNPVVVESDVYLDLFYKCIRASYDADFVVSIVVFHQRTEQYVPLLAQGWALDYDTADAVNTWSISLGTVQNPAATALPTGNSDDAFPSTPSDISTNTTTLTCP
jgi:hypothetical protein